MADRDFRFERHYELWKEQNKQMSRWAFGAVIFATLLLLKILAPYTNLSGRVAAQEAELRKVNADLKAIEGEREVLAKIGGRLDAVRATIDRQPWTAEKDRLILSLRELNQAHRTLSDAHPAQVLEAIREERLAPPGPIGQQIAPLPRQAHPLAQAASVLQLDADRIMAADSSGTFRRLLEEQWGRRVQAEADDKVRRIFQRVNEDFLQPLERLLREDPEAARLLPAMPSMLARTRSDMDQWVRQHLGNRAWYETIQQKDQELSELTGFLRQRQEAFIGLVREQQKTLEPKKSMLADRQQQVLVQAAGIGRALEDLNRKMQELLPDWLRGLVSPEEMLQLYPLVLHGLIALIGFKVGLVRHHYLVVREGQRLQGLALHDAAVSSLWTLVYRGVPGTVATGAVYLGGIALLWWLFEHGSGLTAAWLAGHPSTAWAATKSWLPVVRWLGRVAFAAALVGVAMMLVRDHAAVSRDAAAAGISGPATAGGSGVGEVSPGGRSN